MRVLVTGAAGFVGSAVVRDLFAAKHDVVCLDCLDGFTHLGLPPLIGQEWIFDDVRNVAAHADRLQDVEAVVNTAAVGGVARAMRDPVGLVEANAGGAAALAAWCAATPSVQRVVHMSSFSVYGRNWRYNIPSINRWTSCERNPEDLDAGRFDVYSAGGEVCEVVSMTEGVSPAPAELYGASKLMQELAFCALRPDQRLTTLRCSSIWDLSMNFRSPNLTVVGQVMNARRKGRPFTVYEDGHQTRDLVALSDVCAAIRAVVERGCEHDVVQVCSGQGTSILDMCKAFDVEPVVTGQWRPGDMRDNVGVAGRLKDLLGRPPLPFSAFVLRGKKKAP